MVFERELKQIKEYNFNLVSNRQANARGVSLLGKHDPQQTKNGASKKERKIQNCL